uniref:Aquaporin 14 n=1 Tax=Phasianus colchicus TaxID=9054 RepID=A0A669Q7K6_PHACC
MWSQPLELHSGRFWREVLAEAVATLIFTGVVLGASAAPGPLVPALAGGLAAGTLSCALGAPQANPALTLALLCTHKLGALRGAAVLLAQCAGAVLAATAARLVSAAGTAGQALCWEIFATFQLALTTFASTNHESVPTGLALGCAIIAGALTAVRTPQCPLPVHEPGPLTGAYSCGLNAPQPGWGGGQRQPPGGHLHPCDVGLGMGHLLPPGCVGLGQAGSQCCPPIVSPQNLAGGRGMSQCCPQPQVCC